MDRQEQRYERNRHGSFGNTEYLRSSSITQRRRLPEEKQKEEKKKKADPFSVYIILQTITATTILAVMAGIRFFAGDLYSDIKSGIEASFVTQMDMAQVNEAVFEYVQTTKVFNALFGEPESSETQSSGSASQSSSQSSSESSSQSSSQSADQSGTSRSGSQSSSLAASQNAQQGMGDGEVFKSIVFSYGGELAAADVSAESVALYGESVAGSDVSEQYKPASPETVLLPVSGGVLTSSFGWREDPFTSETAFHNGVDLAVDSGSRVNAAMSGTVLIIGQDDVSGKFIVIEHDNGFLTYYGHLKRITVREAEEVNAGEKIALSGNTGLTTGPHLHFSILKNETYLNPLLYINV